MIELTEEQIKEFYGRFGFRWDGRKASYSFTAPDGQSFSMYELRDFGNLEMLGILFKYVVPKLGFVSLSKSAHHKEYVAVAVNDNINKEAKCFDVDPAVALFQAIYKGVIK